MTNTKKNSFFGKISNALKEMKEDMYKNSVGAAGPSSEGCCHKPVEELERSREKYRQMAMQRNHRNQNKIPG